MTSSSFLSSLSPIHPKAVLATFINAVSDVFQAISGVPTIVTFRLPRISGALKSNFFPRAGSDLASDYLLRALFSQGLKISKDREDKALLGPSCIAGLSSWGKGFCLSPV